MTLRFPFSNSNRQAASVDSDLSPEAQRALTVLDAERSWRGRRIWIRIGRWAGGVLGAIFLLWLILFVTHGRFLRHPFERVAGSLTHRTVKVAGAFELYFAPFDIKLRAEGLTISNPAWATRPNLFEAARIDTRIAPLSLLFGRNRMHWLDLTGGAIDLEWNADHTHNSWTFGETKNARRLMLPIVDRAMLAGTIVRFRDPRLPIVADLTFETIRSRDARIDQAVRFTGTGTVRVTPFTVSGALLSPNATAARGRNQLVLHANAGRNRIDMTGTLPSLAEFENVPLAVTARGKDVSELLEIIGVIVPRTRSYRLAAQLVKSGVDYRFTGMTGTFGDSDLSGNFTVRTGQPRVHVAADLTTRTLDIVDVAPFIGYNPDLVAALGAKAAITHVAGAPRLLPNAMLRVEALRNFDANVRYKVAVLRSKSIPLSNIDLTLALDKSLLTLSPLTLDMARGRVASDVRIDARRRPVHTTYDIRLTPTPIGQLLAGFGALEAGTTGTVKGRLQLEGDGDSVHDSLASANGRVVFVVPGGTFWTRNIQLAELDIGTYLQRLLQQKLKKPVHINCGLVAFTVRDGIGRADPILIDTAKNVITGRGSFSFKTEALDIAFRGDGKKFSLFSAQSPIGLGGYFAAPTINPISRQLVTRAGVGAGLALLMPPAALLAFVDPGDAKSTACGPVLAGATAAGQRTTKGAVLKGLAGGR
jgi:uncharacterized protein involved in outer membrane biogenesis